MAMNVQLPDGRIIQFPDGTDPAVIKSTSKRFIDNPLAGVSTEELKAAPSAGTSIGDIGRSLGTGLVGGVKSIADVFGAGTDVSEYLGETMQGIQAGISPERQAEMARRAELISRADKSGSLMEQAKAYLGGVTEAPLQTTVQALGTSVPTIVAGLATLPASAPAGIAAGVGLISRLAIGAAQGVGEFKGSAYDAVKAHYMKEGKGEEEAGRLAEEAQQYSADKAVQIGGAALLGSLDAVLGSENIAMKAMRRASPTGQMTKEAIEAGIGALPQKALTKPSFGRALGESVIGEAPLEGAQGAFGQYAQNVALQQAGIETPTGEGVFGSGLRDALVGSLAGGAFSPLHKSTMNSAYNIDQFLRQAKGEQELSAMKQESLKAADIEDQRKAKMRSMVEGEPSEMLALPAPAAKAEREIEPALIDLQNPVGRITRNELPADTLSYIDSYRTENNLPRLTSFSLEDVKDAMTSQNPEGERAALDSIIAAKTGYTGKEKYSPEDILNAAVEKNIAPETKGFGDFLQRTTGERDLNTMSQPQLFSAFNALKATKPSATGEQIVLPEGSNATRFTTDQYNEGLTLLGKYLEQGEGKPLSMQQATEVVSAQTDLGDYAKDILRVAATNDDVIVENGPVYNTVDTASGEVTGTYGNQADAEAQLSKGESVQAGRGPLVRSRIEEKKPARAALPGGYEVEEEALQAGEKPAEYQIMAEGKAKPLATVMEETDVAGKVERLQGLRKKEAEKLVSDIAKHEKTVATGRAKLESMEARGEVGSEAYQKAQSQQAKAEKILGTRMSRMKAKIEEYSAPLASKPAGKKQVTRTTFKLTKEGKDVGRFPSRAAAEESALSELSDAELEAISTQEGPTANRAAKALEARKEQAQGKTGIKVKGKAAGLEAAGIYTQDVQAKIDALEKQLVPMLAKFGLGDVGLKIVRTLEAGAEGSYLDKLIQVTLTADQPIVTMRHEALHALKDMGFFTPAQWSVLEKKAKDEWVGKYLKGVMVEVNGKSMTRYDAYANGIKDSKGEWVLKPLTDEEIYEEAIADAFGAFELGTDTPTPGMIAALFKRLQNFFAAFAQALGRAKIESAEEIFGKVERGELAKAGLEQTAKEKLSLKEVKQVADQLDLKEDLLKNTSLDFQTGKTGERQFKTPSIGSLPEVIEFLENRRKATGTRLLETSKSEDREMIADLMAAEAMASINAGGNALTWYDETVARTIGMAALKYPELNNDLNAQMAFKIATAIASQGLNVEDNLTFADKQYAGFSETKKKTGVGQFKEIGSGADAKAMVSNFKMANEMIREYGEDTLRNFLQTEFTVEQLRAAGFKITGELGTETVTGSAIFGPKIGFGFYSNLSGNFEPVTMDMWFMRLIGRLTGKLKEFDSDLFQQQLQRFRTAFNETGEDGVYANDFKPEILDKAKTDEASAIELARVVNSVFNSDFINNRGLYDGQGRKKTELVYAAQTMIGSLDASKDAPKNGTERRELRDIVARTVAKVEKAYGQRIPPAALQALVWYPEQELYKSLGVKLRVTSQDYAGAMAKILKKDGYDERSIRAAAKSGSKQLQRMAVQFVGQPNQQIGQKPRTTFTAQEQAEFLVSARTTAVVKEERVSPKLHKVVFEVAPDPNNIELTNAWRDLDQKTRNEISGRVAKNIIKQAMLDLDVDGVLTSQVGSYIDDTNPSFAFFLKKGNAVDVAKYLGFALSQDSMVILSPRPGPGLEKVGAIVVNVKTQNAKQIDDIYQSLRSIRVNGEQPVGGQSTMNDKMILLNYSDVTTDNLAKLIDEKLGGTYDVETTDVFSAYPEKKDYDYASPQNDPRGKAGAIRERARLLQSQATAELSEELGKVSPTTAGKEAKLSLKKSELPEKMQALGITPEMIDLYKDMYKKDRIVRADTEFATRSEKIQATRAQNKFFDAIAPLNNDAVLMRRIGMYVNDIQPNDEKLSLAKTSFATADEAESAANEKAPPQTPEFKLFYGASTLMDEGRPQVMYHGSDTDISTFYEDKPIFVTPNPKFAEQFAEDRAKDNGKNWREDLNIYPLWVRAETPFDYENSEHVEQVMQRLIADQGATKPDSKLRLNKSTGAVDKVREEMRSGLWSVIEDKTVQDVIKQLGFDSFNVMEGGNKNLAVYSAAQVKSVTGNIGEFSRESKDMRFSLKTARMSEARFDSLLNASDYTQDGAETKAKMYLGFVNPIDFVYANASWSTLKRLRSEQEPLDIEKMKTLGPIYLSMSMDKSGNWKITGHEGRHRMLALADEGFNEIPVVIDFSSGINNTKSIPVKTVNAPKEDALGLIINSDLLITGLEPLSYANRDNARSKFTNFKPVKLSLPTISKEAKDRVNATTTTREQKGWFERITNAISPESRSYLRAKALHRYNQLGVYDRKLAEKMGGVAFLADKSAEAAALMSDLGAGVTASALGFGDRHGGIPVYKNGVTTVDRSVKGLVAALAPLAAHGDPKVYQYYQYWAAVKRGTRLLEAGKERLIDKGDIALAAEFEKKFPEFVQVQKDYTAFNNGIVKYMVDTGVLSQERGNEYMKYADYVPFYRQADGETTIGPNIFQAISGVKPPKKLKGSEAPLADFLETIVRNTQASIQAGMKNSAAQRSINVAAQITEPGMGAVRLDTKQSGPDILNVLEKGEQVSYRTPDSLLVDAIGSLHMPDIPFLGILSAPSDLLRNLVTKDPGFMMANLMRDSLSAWVTSGQKMTPIAGTVINFGKALAGKSPGMEAMMDAGIIGGYEFSANVESSGAKLSQDLLRKSGKEGKAAPLRAARWVWEALEKGTTASDAATRALVYERVMQETGNEAEALYRSLEVMNFNRKGSSPVIRVLTAAVPFFNARLQGLDLFYRASTGNMNMDNAKGIQKAFWTRGAMMMGLTAMYWFLTHDDEEYKKQEQETRDNNWLLPRIGVKMPTPFEVGVLFKTIPERILEYTFGDDTGKDFAKSMGHAMLSTFAFNPIPQTVKPIIEVATNRNFFTMRPMIGQGMEDIAAQYQVGPSTSKTFEEFGRITGLSPIQVEHLYKGYTGTMGMYLVDVVDSILNANSNSPNATKRFEQLPVIKRFALDKEARGTITQYYELKNAVDSTVKTMNMLEKTAKPAEFAAFVQDNKGYLATKDYVRDLEKEMKELREMRSLVRSSTLSGDQKRDANKTLTNAENNLTANIQTIKTVIASMK